MIKRCGIIPESKESKEARELAQWAWDSHYWIENRPGYAQCKWCKKIHTSEMPVDMSYPLCSENPILKRVADEICEAVREAAKG